MVDAYSESLISTMVTPVALAANGIAQP